MSAGESNINAVLARLDLAPLNPGAWSGSHGWASGANVPLLSVRNPATGTSSPRCGRPAAGIRSRHLFRGRDRRRLAGGARPEARRGRPPA